MIGVANMITEYYQITESQLSKDYINVTKVLSRSGTRNLQYKKGHTNTGMPFLYEKTDLEFINKRHCYNSSELR